MDKRQVSGAAERTRASYAGSLVFRFYLQFVWIYPCWGLQIHSGGGWGGHGDVCLGQLVPLLEVLRWTDHGGL